VCVCVCYGIVFHYAYEKRRMEFTLYSQIGDVIPHEMNTRDTQNETH